MWMTFIIYCYLQIVVFKLQIFVLVLKSNESLLIVWRAGGASHKWLVIELRSARVIDGVLVHTLIEISYSLQIQVLFISQIKNFFLLALSTVNIWSRRDLTIEKKVINSYELSLNRLNTLP